MFNDDYGQRAALSQRYRNGANWFYWIAALSLLTSILTFSGANWRFFLSLGVTQLVDAIAIALSRDLGGATKVIAFVLDIFATGLFALLGYLASRRFLWAFVVGMVVFALDGLLSLLITDWVGVVVHGVVLFAMVRGFMAGRELVALERAATEQNPMQAEAPAATV